MTEIALSKGYSAIIDEQDVARLSSHTWWANEKRPGKVYAFTTIRRKTVEMHRFILEAASDIQVDHKNRNTLDNRRENLRLADRFEQAANRGSERSPISGYRGVCFEAKRSRPYRAQCEVRRVRYNGPFRKTAEEAARDYDAFLLAQIPDFAVLNFPSPPEQP